MVADDTVRLYDPDLEQVTVRPLAEVLDDTPVALLTRGTAMLGDDYDIDRLGAERYSLRPRSADALFEEIVLAFGDATPDFRRTLLGIRIVDHFGQTTVIRLHRFQDASVIQSADFELNLPPGIDVF